MEHKVHYGVQIFGLVQGIGMRPFIYRIANTLGLTGFVKNEGASVWIDITGDKYIIEEFLQTVSKGAPANAVIEKVRIHNQVLSEPTGDCGFYIEDSTNTGEQNGLLLPDLAICDTCLKDIMNPKNRRYQYAFTNCIHCGPRYSILKDIPYDRCHTSMDSYTMCSECQTEYQSPDNRRFHAQTNCCPDCGPYYYLTDKNGNILASANVIKESVTLLQKGKIFVIKGVGGFHIVCNAEDEKAVSMVRRRKNRPDKPFAIMASHIGAIKGICYVSKKEEETMISNRRPIVLLRRKENTLFPDLIAPKINQYGVMLPYTPLHYLLFDGGLHYLVMTSANLSGMPICYKNEEVIDKLSNIADYFLMYSREIMTPLDDSVVRIIGKKIMVSRCGRGYAPAYIRVATHQSILAVGGEQKASVCFLHKGSAYMSQYMGSLDNMDACREYRLVVERMKLILKTEPAYVAHDLHDSYYSTRYAEELHKISIPVQHHHAHMASCMAEYGLYNRVIGIIFDGTGLGTDGAAWGGEFLVGDRKGFERAGHLAYCLIQGGDTAVREPFRCAVSYLYSLGIDSKQYFPNIDKISLDLIEKALPQKINCFSTSSIGRLFDCIAALVLHKTHVTYDSQAAIELENVLAVSSEKITEEIYPYSMDKDVAGIRVLSYKEIILGILADLGEGKEASYISAKFHNTICDMTVTCVNLISREYDIKEVVLGGGVFENSYLLSRLCTCLKQLRFQVYHNTKIPMNDGGLSLGQAAVAAAVISNVKEEKNVSGNPCRD